LCKKNNPKLQFSIAEPHHFYAAQAPTPGLNFDETSAPTAIVKQVNFCKTIENYHNCFAIFSFTTLNDDCEWKSKNLLPVQFVKFFNSSYVEPVHQVQSRRSRIVLIRSAGDRIQIFLLNPVLVPEPAPLQCLFNILQGNNISGKTFSVQNPTRFISVSDPH
jgi:hypothetical protein